MVLNAHRNHKDYYNIRDGEKGAWRGGEREIIIPITTVTTRMSPALRWAAMRAILMFQ